MKHIRNVQVVEPTKSNGQQILYLMGYGGKLWHSKRQIKLLSKQGYSIIALDYINVFKTRDPKVFIDLVNEVDELVTERRLLNSTTTIMGVSLGGLIGYNLIKRHKELNKLIIITGGNLARVPAALHQKWPYNYDQLFETWKDVNMHIPVGQLRNKHAIMILPKRDKIIDANEVVAEISKHKPLNNIQLIRTPGGHYRSIITQTITRPKKILNYLKEF